ncbi:MAG: hypothetical protein AAFV25_05165 [Bacteroidota bacterium]
MHPIFIRMKSINFFVSLFCLLLVLAGCGEAPSNESSPEPAVKETKAKKKKDKVKTPGLSFVEKTINRFKKKTALTDEQLKAIRDIGATFEFDNLSKEERTNRRQAFRDRVIAEVLTAEQAALFNQKKKKK